MRVCFPQACRRAKEPAQLRRQRRKAALLRTSRGRIRPAWLCWAFEGSWRGAIEVTGAYQHRWFESLFHETFTGKLWMVSEVFPVYLKVKPEWRGDARESLVICPPFLYFERFKASRKAGRLV